MLRSFFKKNKIELTSYLVVTIIVICAFKILMDMHNPMVDEVVSAALGVTEGRPHWLAFQNRLLGPYTIIGISNISGLSVKSSWYIFNAVALQIFCVLLFWMLRREFFSLRDSFFYLIAILFLFLTLQHTWFYVWDIVDLIIFTLFAYGVLKSFPIRFFFVLFLIGILNRESALFIAIFLMLEAFNFSKGLSSIKLQNFRHLVFGLVLLISGFFYTQYIRSLLFISKSDLTGGGRDIDNELIGNHIHLLYNIKNLFILNFTNRHFLISILLITPFLYFLKSYRSMFDRQLKMLIMALVIFANILIFGLINESRMHFILLPFFIFLWISIKEKNVKVQFNK